MIFTNITCKYFFIVFFIRDDPNPMRVLKSGPAIDPATPISPYPSFESAQFNDKSEAEFPNDNNVIPRKEEGILNIIPIVVNRSTSIFAIVHIQNIDIINAKKQMNLINILLL